MKTSKDTKNKIDNMIGEDNIVKAVGSGDLERVRYLIEKGEQEKLYHHAIMVGVLSESSEVMDELILLMENSTDSEIDEYVELARDSNNEMVVEKILHLARSEKSKNNILVGASGWGRIDLVKKIMKKPHNAKLHYQQAMKQSIVSNRPEMVDFWLEKSYSHKEKIKDFLIKYGILNDTQKYFLARCEAYEIKKEIRDEVAFEKQDKKGRKI